MFERLSNTAVGVVLVGQQEARALGHGQVGTEHLLLGLLANERTGAGRLLVQSGVTLEGARSKVAEAVAKATGPLPEDELPLSARASRAIDRAHRFSLQRRQATVTPEMLLLGVLDVEGLACQVLRRLGVDVTALNPKVAELPLGEQPPVPDGVPTDAELDDQQPPMTPHRHTLPKVPDDRIDPTPRAAEPAEPRCPWCRAALEASLGRKNLDVLDNGDSTPMVAVYCTVCGTTVAVLPRSSGPRPGGRKPASKT